MKTLFLDFETYYDKEYSLRKMTPVEYILDPRFETHGCAFKQGTEGQTYWVDGPDLAREFARHDPNDTMTVAHNAPFDASIAAWRYGFVPRLMVDTLGLSRAVFGHILTSHSLNSVASHLGIGAKTGALVKTLGLRFEQIASMPDLYREFVEYATIDVDLCAGIFKHVVVENQFPASELVVMDSVLRCVVEPAFRLDRTLLLEHLQDTQAKKAEQLAMAILAGASGKGDLMSNDKFAGLLREVGVEPPTKISALTGRTTYAFAKSDPEFNDLLEHPDPRVQTLVAARLGHKSTIEETRTQRFLAISNVVWPDGEVGRMPVPLRYAGAHTHRLSGDWKMNLQNLGRGSKLRDALIAPPGHYVYAPDASQIEARFVATFCGQEDLRLQFANKEDVYSSFASRVFGYPVNKKEHPAERFIGKTGVLGLGYGVGWQKFQLQVLIQSTNMVAAGILPEVISLSDVEGQRIVNLYRGGYYNVPAMWRRLNNLIGVLANGGTAEVGPVILAKGEIVGPNGLKLYYPNLRHAGDGWTYKYGRLTKRLYGGALLENIIQFLARIVVMDAGVRIRKRIQTFAMQVHDELVFIVRDDRLEDLKSIAMEEMTRPPAWMPDLPLAAEGNWGRTYGAAK